MVNNEGLETFIRLLKRFKKMKIKEKNEMIHWYELARFGDSEVCPCCGKK